MPAEKPHPSLPHSVVEETSAESFSPVPSVKILLFPFALTCVFSVQLFRLGFPDVVGNYPFHYPDSFDWIVNALSYVERFLYGRHDLDITVRQPLFPALIAVSELIRLPQVVLALLPLTFFGSIAAFFQIGRLLRVRSAVLVVGTVVLSLSYPLAFYSFYYMADPFAVMLMLWSAVFYVQALTDDSRETSSAFRGAVCACFAAITQLYGLFPTLVFSGLTFLRGLVQRSPRKVFLGCAVLCVALFGQGLWMIAKKVLFGSFLASKVVQFGYLQLTLANLDFYRTVWPIYFAPLLAICVLLLPFARFAKFPKAQRSAALYLVLLIGALTSFVFFYQVQDSRFTTYFIYLVYALTLFGADLLTRKKLPGWYLVLPTAVGGYLSFTHTDYLDRPNWAPYADAVSHPRAQLETNIFTRLFASEPAERLKDNPCLARSPATGEINIPESCLQLPVHIYVNQSLKFYLDYRSLTK
ncbi:MAG: hypothetical protein U0136_07990 [Bdellovibrionota bacterium]